MPTLDQLRVLAAIQDAGTFEAAAARLHRVQSAVSYAVRMLEEELGVPLFDRSGHRARLTAAGDAVLGKGREVLGKAQELSALGEELRAGWEPRLTLLLDGAIPVKLVLPHLRRFTTGRLPTQFSVRVELLGGVLDALERDRPDVAVMALGLPLPDGYASDEFADAVMLPVVAASHPLAAERSPVSLETLRKHVHLIVSDSTRHRVPIDAGLIGAPQRWNFPDFLSRLEALRAGMGFAWMPTYLVEPDLRRGTLVPLLVEQRPPVRYRVARVHRTEPPLGRAGRLLLDALQRGKPILPKVPEALVARYTWKGRRDRTSR